MSTMQKSQELGVEPFLTQIRDLAEILETNIETGLTEDRAKALLKEYFPNVVKDAEQTPWYMILLRHFFNALNIILYGATAVSFGVGEHVSGGVLVGVVGVNIAVGFFEDFRAAKKVLSLKSLSSPTAAVLRDGVVKTIPSAEVVPGDTVVLRTGDTVPADLRVFEAMNLRCNEANLTGEAESAEKTTAIVSSGGKLITDPKDVGTADRTNLAYATTQVIKGRGRGLVIATGSFTVVGKLANPKSDAHRAKAEAKSKAGEATPKAGEAETERPSLNMEERVLRLLRKASRRIGRILQTFLGLDDATPLQKQLAQVAFSLLGFALVLAFIVFAVNKFKVTSEVANYAISTAVAIIPECLNIVLLVTQVTGAKEMQGVHVIIRNMAALEELGGVTNICSDKTGTLTQGAMIVKQVWLPRFGMYKVDDAKDPSDPTQGFVTELPDSNIKNLEERPEMSSSSNEVEVPSSEVISASQVSHSNMALVKRSPALESFLRATSLCNLATVRRETSSKTKESVWKTTGEPTEIAMQVFVCRFNSGKQDLLQQDWMEVAEFPFDSTTKRMSVVYKDAREDTFVFSKGAVERILGLCSAVYNGSTSEVLTEELKQTILDKMDFIACQGQRVLAVASRPLTEGFPASQSMEESDDEMRKVVEKDLTFLGLVGIYDPPRPETADSIRKCMDAGIKVHMLTGDHVSTATAIGKEISLLPQNFSTLPSSMKNHVVMVATDFDRMDDAEVDALSELPTVIGRCSPETKTRMIEALHRRGASTAMTGDGVNDAPSLMKARIGIAMGVNGSDVAKQAAKIVLSDDNFRSIVSAIQEGRRMSDNIRKFIIHLLTSNVAEVVLLIFGLAFKDSTGQSVFPQSPLAILWINMVTSSFPAFGLGREPAAANIMRRRPNKKAVFSAELIMDIVAYGLLMGILVLVSFVIVVWGAYKGDLGHDCNITYTEHEGEIICGAVYRARAAVFAELTWLILISAWEFKSPDRSMFSLQPAFDPEPVSNGSNPASTPVTVSGSSFPFFKDVYENKKLFWAVVIGALTVFPAIYVPYLNTTIFKHAPITWEWTLVFGGLITFVAGVEAWKAAKRRWHWFQNGFAFWKPNGGKDERKSTVLPESKRSSLAVSAV